MAWTFSLSAECGTHKESAALLARHFDAFTVQLANGSRHQCRTGIGEEAGAWWASVCPERVSRSGIRDENDATQMTEIGLALYEHLRSAPQVYRYAVVGVEADGFCSIEDLGDQILGVDGLVVTDTIWQRLGSPATFLPFSAGYCWRPFVRAT